MRLRPYFVLSLLMLSPACASAPDAAPDRGSDPEKDPRDAELRALREELAALRRRVELVPAQGPTGDPRATPLGVCPVGTTPYDETVDRQQQRGCRDAQGRLTGPWEMVERGERVALGSYEAGVAVGAWWRWDKHDKVFELIEQGSFEHGVKVGLWRETCRVDLPFAELSDIEGSSPKLWTHFVQVLNPLTPLARERGFIARATPSLKLSVAPPSITTLSGEEAEHAMRCEGAYVAGLRGGSWRFGVDETFALTFVAGELDGAIDVSAGGFELRGRMVRGKVDGPFVWGGGFGRYETAFEDGKPVGLWVTTHTIMALKTGARDEIRFEDGVLVSAQRVDGDRTWRFGIEDGKLDGPVTVEVAGKRATIGAFDAGAPTGSWRFRDGDRAIAEVRYGKTTDFTIFGEDAGAIASGSYDASGARVGRWRMPTSGEALHDLLAVTEGAYVDGLRQGPWQACAKLEANYIPGDWYCGALTFKAGKLHGKVSVRDDDHRIEANYVDGKLAGTLLVRDEKSVVRKVVIEGANIDQTEYEDGNPSERTVCGPASGKDDGVCIIAERWNARGLRRALVEPIAQGTALRVRKWDDEGALVEDVERDRGSAAPVGKYLAVDSSQDIRGQFAPVERGAAGKVNSAGYVAVGRWSIRTDYGFRLEGELKNGLQVGRWRKLDATGNELESAVFDATGKRVSGDESFELMETLGRLTSP